MQVAAPASPAMAQSILTCKEIALTAPAEGKNFTGTRPIFFSWSGEPAGTATRDLHLAGLDGSETVVSLDGRFSDTVKVRMTGDLAWAVVFRDAAGKALCTTPARILTKGTGGGRIAASNDSLSGSGPGGAAKVAVFMNNGRLVIVLQNSPYTGQYTKLVAADDYDGTGEDLMGADGLEIHGNNAQNLVTGSPKNDVIFLYGARDIAEGGLGNDILSGGDGNDDLYDTAGGGDADVLYGGPDIDYLNSLDGDANDVMYGGSSSDGFQLGEGDRFVGEGPEGP